MHFLPLTFLYCLAILTAGVQSVEHTPAPSKRKTEPALTNILLQSTDGGKTWQDISQGLPEAVQPQDFFAGASELYVRVNDVLYHSKSSLKTPVWEKENVLDPQEVSIAFNRSGVITYTYDGKMHRKTLASGAWMPIYTTFKKQTIRTIFESADGAVFIGSDNGLYKSTDKGKTWKQVQNEGWVMDIVESEGVLIGTGQKGIMRSTDKGEHWEWVISEGGVGIDVERIQGGFAAIVYSSKSQSRKIYLSQDSGKNWKAIDDGLMPSVSTSSIKQVGHHLLLGHPEGIFLSADMGKSWKRVYAGAPQNVFATINFLNNGAAVENRKVHTLYTSGNVVYAVLRDFGC